MNKIRELRLSLGLTQADLAKMLGLNHSAVGKYERCELEPSLSTLRLLSRIFECSIDYIVGNSDDFGNVTIANAGAQLPAEAQELVEMFLSLSPAHRIQILEYTKYFTERENATKKRG